MSIWALSVPSDLTAAPMETVCVRTPAMALRVIVNGNATGTMVAQSEGYRITTTRLDPLLRQRWAMIASCGHPDRPLIAMLLPEQKAVAVLSSIGNPTNDQLSNSVQVVHAGDPVKLLVYEKNLRMEMAGRAEESGTLGSRVRVRLLSSGFDVGRKQTFVGIVRGPGKIEMQP